jgi:deazaflavin-dependent oxidoreductase (nitroreductase family)
MKEATKTQKRSAGHRSRRPHNLLRLAFRLPLFIYRCRLGWLLGHRFLLLTHRGRKSGAIHETMLEVLHYDPATCESIVFSGMGTRADWYRNIAAHPALAVRTGRQRYTPSHRVLTRQEVAAVGARFAREHPWEIRLIAPVLKRLGWSMGDTSATGGLPPDSVLVAFRPRGEG